MDIEQSLDSIKESLVSTRYAQARESFLNGYKSEYPIDFEFHYFNRKSIYIFTYYHYFQLLRISFILLSLKIDETIKNTHENHIIIKRLCLYKM